MDGVIVRERIAGHPGVAELMLDRAEAMNAINTADSSATITSQHSASSQPPPRA